MYVNETYPSHVDVGLERPRGSSPVDIWEGAYFFHRGDDEMIELEDKICWLTLDILDITMDDLPRMY